MTNTSQTATLGGTVSMGDRVRSATVVATLINIDGTEGAEVGRGTTDSAGGFSLSVTASSGAALRLTVTGGSVNDLPTGQLISVQAGALVLDLSPASGDRVALQVTPLTTFAHKIARKKIAAGLALPLAITQAHKETGRQFGITTLDLGGNTLDGDITTTLPRTEGATTAEQRYELSLIALAQLAKDLNASPVELVSTLAKDAEDGVFDGLVDSLPITFRTSSGDRRTLPTDAVFASLATALTSFLQSGRNGTGLTPSSTAALDLTNNIMATLVVRPASALLSVGQSQQFLVSALNSAGNVIDFGGGRTGSVVTWNSGSSAVATVNTQGLVTGLAPGTTWINATMGGIKSNLVTVTVVRPVPTLPAPTGVSVAAGNGQVTVSWKPVPGATSYTIYMASQSGVTKGNHGNLPNGMKHTGVTSSYVHAGLTNGTAYYFVVTAVSAEDESSESREVPARPSAVPAMVLSVTAGIGHVCAVLSDGTVTCWGDNFAGKLGDGTTTNSSIPVTVTGIGTATVVASGENHTCALLSDGTVKCWGANYTGQLGDGTENHRFTPVAVTGITTATAIAAGIDHTCILLLDSTVKCWGWNYRGGLGNGTTVGSSTPVTVTGGIASVAGLAAGGEHTCAVLADGTVKCWGQNAAGQLGTTTSQLCAQLFCSTTPVTVPNVTTATAVATRDAHTCARLADGTVKCWGLNSSGQLGNGGTVDSWTPVTVTGVTTATAVAAGGHHTCALLADGTARCWGYNAFGELGDGTVARSSTPITVTGITTATQLTAGAIFTCALLSDHSVKCWGGNMSGQLGNGTTTNSSTPVTASGF